MISLIAAIGKNNELGKNNNLIWNLPNDLKFFKEKTLEHKIIMGLNTYNSIGKPLPRRKNIVITDKKIELPHEVTVYYDMEKLIENEINDKEEVFIIGGASLYNYFYNKADRMYLTLIEKEDEDATVYFPKIENDKWHKTILGYNEDNNIKYKHVLFEKIR